MSKQENHHVLLNWNAAGKKSINPLDINKEDLEIYCKGIKKIYYNFLSLLNHFSIKERQVKTPFVKDWKDGFVYFLLEHNSFSFDPRLRELFSILFYLV